MQTDDTKGFDNAHLQAWWAATRYYLSADLENLPRAIDRAGDGWPPSQMDSHGSRKRFIARARGRLLRSLGCGEHDDPLRELERAFQRQIAFIAWHPEVPRRLLTWLRQDGDVRLRRRIQAVIGHYAGRLARLIGQARQQGLVRSDIEPQSEAMRLVGLIQNLALGIDPCTTQRETLFREAASTFALFRAGLSNHSPGRPDYGADAFSALGAALVQRLECPRAAVE